MQIKLPVKLAFFTFIVVGAGVFAVAQQAWINADAMLRQQAGMHLAKDISREALDFENVFKAVEKDLRFLAASGPVQRSIGGHFPGKNANLPAEKGLRKQSPDFWEERVAGLFGVILQQHPVYQELSFIGRPEDGGAVVTVRRVGDAVRQVAVEPLTPLASQAAAAMFAAVAGAVSFSAVTLHPKSDDRGAGPGFFAGIVVRDAANTEIGGILLETHLMKAGSVNHRDLTDYCFFVADRQGKLLISDVCIDCSREGGPSVSDLTIGQFLPLQQGSSVMHTVVAAGRDYRVLLRDFRYPADAENSTMIVGAAAPYDVFGKNSRTYWKNLSRTVVIVVLFCSLVIAGIVKFITRPIMELTQACRQIGEGEKEVVIPVGGGDEVGVLGRTVKAMLGQLAAVERRREELVQNLAEKVSERTADLNAANITLRQEIEDRKKTAGELAVYQKIVASSRDLLSYIDRNYIYQAVNESYLEYHVHTREEIVGHSVPEILGREVFESIVREKFVRCLQGEIIRYENWFTYGRKGDRYMEITYAPDREPSGTVAGILVNARDATERRMLNVQLQEDEKIRAVGRLAAGIAHDFNNLLHGIAGSLEGLKPLAAADSSCAAAIAGLFAAVHRAAGLVQQILTFSRQSSQEKKPLLLQNQVREFVAREGRKQEPDVKIIIADIDDAAGPVLSSEVQVNQILDNLLKNSRDAMKKSGGQITIALTGEETGEEGAGEPDLAAGPRVHLRFADTGEGIDPETRQRIFDPYFSTKETTVGTGLGLAIVAAIMKDHHGTITVASEPGKGTVFDLFFPVTDQLPALEEAAVEPEIIRLPAGVRILYVDDEQLNVDTWIIALKRQGCVVTGMVDPGEALGVFTENPEGFDLVLVDQKMPGMTGTELATSILQLRPAMPIILITGWADSVSEAQMKALGIREILTKPHEMPTLLQAVCRAIG